MKESRIVLITLLILAVSCGRRDYMEYCGIGYSDVVSFIVQGYQSHWDGIEPGEMQLSDVYHYCSLYGGSQQIDINGDQVPELLIGDQFEGGHYSLYDIYTFDRKTGETIHLLCGGERDTFVICSDGTIIERGSNSASDSFIKAYKFQGIELTEQENVPDDIELMTLSLDPFFRYVAPASYVVIKDGELMGSLYKSFEDHYVVEAQDTVSISKEGAEIEFWSAWDGRGVIYLTEPGRVSVYEENDTASSVIGEAVHIEGYSPETYECLGYLPGWFKIRYESQEGFVPQEYCSWDYADRF